MSKKKVGFWLEEDAADRLDAMSERFDGLKGELVAAALRLFFEAETDVQRAALKGVMGAKVDRLFEAAEARPEAHKKKGKGPKIDLLLIDSRTPAGKPKQ